jgi:hypothetical protein
MFCDKCGRNLALVGKAHHCRPPVDIVKVSTEVLDTPKLLTPELTKGDVNTAVNKAAQRKEYMKAYMKKRRARVNG